MLDWHSCQISGAYWNESMCYPPETKILLLLTIPVNVCKKDTFSCTFYIPLIHENKMALLSGITATMVH